MLASAANGESLQPQDLVITLLGTYVRPFGADRVVGRPGDAARRVRVLARRRPRRADPARTPRSDRAGAVRAARPLPGDAAVRSAADRGRRPDLHARPARATRDSWTVLWHQIPEDRRLERTRLARRLRFLGFGSVQDSVWVSPHDHSAEVVDLLGELGVADAATVFVARVGDVGAGSGLPALVARAWDLSGLVERYEAFCSRFERYLAPDAPAVSDRRGVPSPHAARAPVPRLSAPRPRVAPRTSRRCRDRVRAAAAIFESLYDRARGPVTAAFRRRDGVRAAPSAVGVVPLGNETRT